jgi:hypothetical protein
MEVEHRLGPLLQRGSIRFDETRSEVGRSIAEQIDRQSYAVVNRSLAKKLLRNNPSIGAPTFGLRSTDRPAADAP